MFEIHEIPTREETTLSLKVNKPPTAVSQESEVADPDGRRILPSVALAEKTFAAEGVALKYPPILMSLSDFKGSD